MFISKEKNYIHGNNFKVYTETTWVDYQMTRADIARINICRMRKKLKELEAEREIQLKVIQLTQLKLLNTESEQEFQRINEELTCWRIPALRRLEHEIYIIKCKLER